MKIDREELHSMIEKAGFSCGKNTAMVDVFDRFSQLVITKMKETPCEVKPVSKPGVKIDRALSPSSQSSASSPSVSLSSPSQDSKQITIE